MQLTKLACLMLALMFGSGCTLLGVETDSKRTVVHTNDEQRVKFDDISRRLDQLEQRLNKLEDR